MRLWVLCVAILAGCGQMDSEVKSNEIQGPKYTADQLVGVYKYALPLKEYSFSPSGERKVEIKGEVDYRTLFNPDFTFYNYEIHKDKPVLSWQGVWKLVDGNRLVLCGNLVQYASFDKIGAYNVKIMDDDTMILKTENPLMITLEDHPLHRTTTELTPEPIDLARVDEFNNKLNAYLEAWNEFDYEFEPADSEADLKEECLEAIQNKDVEKLTNMTAMFRINPRSEFLINFNLLRSSAWPMDVKDDPREDVQRRERSMLKHGMKRPPELVCTGTLMVRFVPPEGEKGYGGSVGVELGTYNGEWAIVPGVYDEIEKPVPSNEID